MAELSQKWSDAVFASVDAVSIVSQFGDKIVHKAELSLVEFDDQYGAQVSAKMPG